MVQALAARELFYRYESVVCELAGQVAGYATYHIDTGLGLGEIGNNAVHPDHQGQGIGWWPLMLQEYEESCEHYRRLGVEDRIEIDLHEGGHEIVMGRSLEFLKKWLSP